MPLPSIKISRIGTFRMFLPWCVFSLSCGMDAIRSNSLLPGPIFLHPAHLFSSQNQMFWGAYSFNRPLNKWGGKVGNVVFTYGMFLDATSFNRPLDKWKLSSLESMSSMFYGANRFNQNLCSWTDDLPRSFSCDSSDPLYNPFAGTLCPVQSECNFGNLCHHCETTTTTSTTTMMRSSINY